MRSCCLNQQTRPYELNEIERMIYWLPRERWHVGNAAGNIHLKCVHDEAGKVVSFENPVNAEFVAVAKDAMPWLVEEVVRLRQLVDSHRTMVEP